MEPLIFVPGMITHFVTFDCIWPQIKKNSNQYQLLTKDANQITGCSKPQQVTHINLLLQCQHPSTLSVALKTLTSLFSPLSVSFCNLHIAFLPCIASHVFSNPLTFHSGVPPAESKAGALPQPQPSTTAFNYGPVSGETNRMLRS